MKPAELKLLQQSLNYLSIKDFSIEELKQILRIKKELTSKAKDIDDLQEEVMKKYEIVGDQYKNYNWNGHPEFNAISKDINLIMESEYTIEGLNFLPLEKIKLIKDIDSITIMESLIDNLEIK